MTSHALPVNVCKTVQRLCPFAIKPAPGGICRADIAQYLRHSRYGPCGAADLTPCDRYEHRIGYLNQLCGMDPRGRVVLMSVLPFEPFNSSFRDVLREKYIRKVVGWVIGDDVDRIPAQRAGSCWEAALSVLLFAECEEVFASASPEDEALRKSFADRAAAVVRWLLSQRQSLQENGQTFSTWEGVTWDTSVVVRALLAAMSTYPNSFSVIERDLIHTAIGQAVSWLFFRFDQWDDDVKYPFGPADVAQIAITLCTIRINHPQLHAKLQSLLPQQHADPIVCIIDYLLHIKKDRTLQVSMDASEQAQIQICWWEDYFNTAEVLEALAYCCHFAESDTSFAANNKELLCRVRDAIVRACGFFDQSQVGGMWGTHIDTLKVAQALVKLTSLLAARGSKEGDLGQERFCPVPEIHTLFKALRWSCDEKQVFSDGSFLHTMFLTIFYAHLLVGVYKSWPPGQLTIDQLYDNALWCAPVRSTPERSRRLAATLKLVEAESHIALLTRQLVASTRTQWTILAIPFLALVFIFIGVLADVLNMQASATITPGNTPPTVTLVGIWIALTTTIVTLIWKLPMRIPERTTRDPGKLL